MRIRGKLGIGNDGRVMTEQNDKVPGIDRICNTFDVRFAGKLVIQTGEEDLPGCDVNRST